MSYHKHFDHLGRARKIASWRMSDFVILGVLVGTAVAFVKGWL